MNTFLKLGLSKDFVKGLTELGIVTPSPIQEQVIPVLLGNEVDLVGQAQTGTGKTAAFGLPLLHAINPKIPQVQGLILCPTRELGQQVAKQLFRFTKYTEKIFTEAVYGGQHIDRQIVALKRPTHIVVATPGRLIDLVDRKAVDLSAVHTIVLDEADEMLSMGFKKELQRILTLVSSARNKWLFSATMPHDIRQIVNQHLREDAVRIEVSGKDVVNKNIDHQYLICDQEAKLHVLHQFLKAQNDNRGIIFCRTKASTQKLAKQLLAKNIPSDALHGDLKQIERDKVMRAFKNESVQILVCTDITARGIDIKGLAYVVHYELPDKDEYYAHRSGRTARAGEKGVSLALVTSREAKQIKFLETKLNIVFTQLRPTR